MTYDPNNPFAGGFTAGAGGLVKQAGQQGYFNPAGNAGYRATMQRRLLQQGRSRQQRAMVLAHLAGLSGIGQQQAMVDTNQDVAGTTSDTLNNFDANQYGQNQDYFRGLLGGQVGHEDQLRQEALARHNQFMDFLGGLGGAAGNLGVSYLTGGLSGAAKPRKSSNPGYGGTY